MKILIVTPKVSENGGIERYTVELVRRLSKHHKIFILTQKTETNFEGVDFFVEKIIEKPLWLNHLIFFFWSYFWSQDIKKKNNIDLIFANGSALVKTDIAVAHSFHEAGIVESNRLRKLENPGLKTYLRCFLKWLWPQNLVGVLLELIVYCFGSKKIISVSSGVKRELISYFKIKSAKITAIPNGVDLEKFKPDEGIRNDMRKELGMQEDEIVIAFSGHEFQRKGLRFIIESLALASSPKLRLLVMGRDNFDFYRMMAEKLKVQDKIIFLGRIQSGIEKYYCASDIFVFPTGYEAFSLATLEAGAAGLPLLLTRVNGTEELLIDGVNGFFVERNGKSIAEKLDILTRDKELLDKMKIKSREIALNYSWDITASNTEKIIEEVYKNKNN